MDSARPSTSADAQAPRATASGDYGSQIDPTGRSINRSGSGWHHDRQAHADNTGTNVLQRESTSPQLRRAGLLQPNSYNPSSSSMLNKDQTSPRTHPVVPHTLDAIRLSTVELSNMHFQPSPNQDSTLHDPSLFSDALSSSLSSMNSRVQVPQDVSSSSSPLSVSTVLSLSPRAPMASPISQPTSGSATPRGPIQPSGLSLLRRKHDIEDNDTDSGSVTPTASKPNMALSITTPPSPMSRLPSPAITQGTISSALHPVSESTPLLTPSPPLPSYSPLPPPPPSSLRFAVPKLFTLNKLLFSKQNVRETSRTAFKSLPAVVLGSLLNILDGISYGMLVFPATGVFANLGPMGVSMFFVTAVVAQSVYTFGGSGFPGANGSMVIEVVPFFHIIAATIAKEIGEDKPREIIATTLVAYALSSLLTGLTFFLLGALRLGVLIGFFPRHILVGCIGGVGVFLIQTGLTVSLRVDEGAVNMFNAMFLDGHNVALWAVPLGLGVLLRAITHRWHHQLIFPLYFIIIPMLFYVVVAAAQLDMSQLRADGWVFDMGPSEEHEAWYKFYTYYEFGAVSFKALWVTLPTQFALLFFNILHPPLNVPTLAVSLDEDIDTNKELVAHGYSNLLAGCLGTMPNYLVYVNTLLFYRLGGGTRVAGFMLVGANIAMLLVGTGPIAYIPIMVVGALIFVLGYDLVKEALWDTRHRVSMMEYITIVCIMVCMTVWDFVAGVLLGIIVSCFFFVVQNSQRRSIRTLHTGETAMSTVRRPSLQRAYLREVSRQTTIVRLQGFLFFGTIAYVEETIRGIMEGKSWQRNPVRFLVLDLSHVAGVDMSSAEAFVRIQKMLWLKGVVLLFCGFEADSTVGKALDSVDVLGAEGVELFSTFSDAMEWTDNEYLRAWFRSQKSETSVTAFAALSRRGSDMPDFQQSFVDSLGSPRRAHIRDAGNQTIGNEVLPHVDSTTSSEPLNTLVKAFSSYGEVNFEEFQRMEVYLERMSVPEGVVLWKQGDPSDGLYIIESGILRATYEFAHYTQSIEESMVPGTLAGELSALADLPRNATAIVERPAILWKLSAVGLRRLEEEEPALSRKFLQLVLKAAKMDYDILLAALASRQ